MAEGLGCALQWGRLELAGTGCARHRAAPVSPLLTAATPQPLLPAPGHGHTMHW